MAKPVLGKSVRSDWFLLGRDFAVRIVSMETVQAMYFCFEHSRQIQNLQPKKRKKKKCGYCHSSSRNYQKKLKRLTFYWDFKDEWRRRTFSERVQYYPEHPETFDSETETSIIENQEAIDDFINQQKSANTNKKKATDMNTLLRYVEANGMKNEKIESLSASELDHFLSKFVWTHGGKT